MESLVSIEISDYKLRNSEGFKIDLYKGEIHVLLFLDFFDRKGFINFLKNRTNGKIYYKGNYIPLNFKIITSNGIGFLLDENYLLDNLTIAENLVVATPKKLHSLNIKRCFLKKKKIEEECKNFLEKYSINLDPNQKIYNLSVEEKKLVMIVKLFSLEPKVIILYEPTAYLSLESIKLFDLMVKDYVRRGGAALYVTSSWEESLKLGDRVSVVLNSSLERTFSSKELKHDSRKILQYIIGKEKRYKERSSVTQKDNKLIESVFEAAEYLSSEYELDDILNLLAKNAAKAMKADACSISLLDKETNAIIGKSFYKRNKNIEVLPNDYEIFKMVDDERIYYFTKRDRGFEKFFKINKDICSFICVPLYIRSRLSGIIQIYYKDFYLYSEEEIKYLETIAHQAALAIHDTRLMGNSVLLQESHHRIKNNLQSIISLMSLYKMSFKKNPQKDVDEMLDDLISKIKSIAAVHDLLSKDKLGRSIINLKEMIIQIIKFMKGTKDKIEFEYNLDDIFVSYSKASAIALVVNEIVTNSLKYAFSEKNKGKISIFCKYNNEKIHLVISDNGKGFPENFQLTTNNGLGLSIVYSIVTKQLGGKIKTKNDYGAKVFIEIPFKRDKENIFEEKIEKV